MKSLEKTNPPITKNCLTTSIIKTEQNFQRRYGILSQQTTTLKLPGKSYEDATPVNRAILRYNLCLNEKLEIATHQGKNLNKRSEPASKCKHLTNFYYSTSRIVSHITYLFYCTRSPLVKI